MFQSRDSPALLTSTRLGVSSTPCGGASRLQCDSLYVNRHGRESVHFWPCTRLHCCRLALDSNGCLMSGSTRSQVHELALVEVAIEPTCGQQFLVATSLDDAAGLHDADLIGVQDGAQPVGDDDGRPSEQQPL
jgi:hypothetical protein